MAKIDLMPHEAILKSDSSIFHERAGSKNPWTGELFLTNLALIVTHRGAFGGVKETVRLPLDQVQVVDGVPQVLAGRSVSSENQLHVYFTHGVESFTLGDADEDGEFSLKDLFVSQSEKEKRNIEAWRKAISQAVDAVQRGASPTAMAQASTLSQRKSPGKSSFATVRCLGCWAPISGERGQKVSCSYCDTEQVIS